MNGRAVQPSCMLRQHLPAWLSLHGTTLTDTSMSYPKHLQQLPALLGSPLMQAAVHSSDLAVRMGYRMLYSIISVCCLSACPTTPAGTSIQHPELAGHRRIARLLHHPLANRAWLRVASAHSEGATWRADCGQGSAQPRRLAQSKRVHLSPCFLLLNPDMKP